MTSYSITQAATWTSKLLPLLLQDQDLAFCVEFYNNSVKLYDFIYKLIIN